MCSDAFQTRGQSFEEGYFRNKDAELVDKLRAVFKTNVDREHLRAAGIQDEAVIDRLLQISLKGEMLAAFKLYPLVEVAWADGSIDKREVEAVLAAAVKVGIPQTGEAITGLKEWLNRGPNENSRAAWRMFAGELRKTLSPKELAEFREDLVKFAKEVANASGGLMGLVMKVDVREQRVIDTLQRLLS